MKKIIGSIGKWFMKTETQKTIVEGIEVVGKTSVNKKKVYAVIAIVVVVVNLVALLSGKISPEQFIDNNTDAIELVD